MLEKFDRALDLGTACWKALMLDKEMLVFPLLSLLGVAAALGGVFAPVVLSGNWQTLAQSLAADPQLEDPRLLVVGFLLLFLIHFVVTFFNAALLACAMIRFAGGDPTVIDGLRASVRNLPQILAWALFTASIGFLLNLIASRIKGLAQFGVRLLGAGWAIASYFAVPVLVVEGVGPIAAVRRSVGLLRKSWGEALVAHAGLSALNYIGVLVGLPLMLWGTFNLGPRPELALAAIVGGVAWMFITAFVLTTLSSILKAALYVYAYEGRVPVNFDAAMIRDAFRGD